MPTIAAIATPPGNGGIGIIRLSGPGAKVLLSRVFLPHAEKFVNFKPYTLHKGILLDCHNSPLDEVLAVFMPGPHSYTGEDVAEIHCHGGSLLLEEALGNLLRLGARLAEPGEFTRRAFLNGRMDLSQAEAVAELISAPSREALANSLCRLEGRLTKEVEKLQNQLNELRALASAAVDFPEEETEIVQTDLCRTRAEEAVEAIQHLLVGADRAQIMANGALVVLAGPVNVGKSSLLNALCGENRALVANLPGTTRDFIEAQINLGGLPVRLVDTAGLRSGGDALECMGMARTRDMMARADLILYVLDAAKQTDWLPDTPVDDGNLLIWNKCDLASPPASPLWAKNLNACSVSALTGENLDLLQELLRKRLLKPLGAIPPEGHVPPNMRQARALRAAASELSNFAAQLGAGESYDCCLTYLDTALAHLDGILSLAADDEILDIIFSQFCIGK